MRAISQRIQGQLIKKNGANALFLHQAKPERDAPSLLYLRYAFVTLGPEDHIFPAFLLDDWGAEVRGLKLYRWFREHAAEFPRAEIFGFGRDGKEVQCFAREIEQYVKFPCYVFADRDQAIQKGVLISSIYLQDDAAVEETKLNHPPKETVLAPLRRARVTWWAAQEGLL